MFYEFKCETHGTFDEWQSMNDEHKANCPECEKPAARKYHAAKHKVDFTAGYDHGLGEFVNTKAQRDNIVSELNLRRIRD